MVLHHSVLENFKPAVVWLIWRVYSTRGLAEMRVRRKASQTRLIEDLEAVVSQKLSEVAELREQGRWLRHKVATLDIAISHITAIIDLHRARRHPIALGVESFKSYGQYPASTGCTFEGAGADAGGTAELTTRPSTSSSSTATHETDPAHGYHPAGTTSPMSQGFGSTPFNRQLSEAQPLSSHDSSGKAASRQLQVHWWQPGSCADEALAATSTVEDLKAAICRDVQLLSCLLP